MPVKFGPTQVIVERGTGKKTTTHQYMKQQSIKTLIEKFNNTSTTGKLKRKINIDAIRKRIIFFGVNRIVAKNNIINPTNRFI